MAEIHIEEFYKDSARILTQLYLSFPRKGSVFVEDISGADQADEFGLHSKRHLACLGAMIWLAEEGYIRFEDTIRQEAIDQAILSHKGLSLLTKIWPQSFKLGARDKEQLFSHETGATLIQHGLEIGTSTQLTQLMLTLLHAEEDA